MNPGNQDRLDAIAEGRKKYNGRPCRKCGATEKYVNGSACVACSKKTTANRDPEIGKRYYSTKGKEGKRERAREWRARQITGEAALGQTYPNFDVTQYKSKEKLKYINERLNRPSARQKYELKRKYGMSIEEYNDLRFIQDSRCQGCKEQYDQLVVDHCHETGQVRGLLCRKCNTALGFVRDRVDILTGLADYIMRHKGQ